MPQKLPMLDPGRILDIGGQGFLTLKNVVKFKSGQGILKVLKPSSDASDEPDKIPADKSQTSHPGYP